MCGHQKKIRDNGERGGTARWGREEDARGWGKERGTRRERPRGGSPPCVPAARVPLGGTWTAAGDRALRDTEVLRGLLGMGELRPCCCRGLREGRATAPCRLLHPRSPCRGDLKYLLCYQHSPVAARYKSMLRSAARENQIHNAVDGNIELSSLFLSSS